MTAEKEKGIGYKGAHFVSFLDYGSNRIYSIAEIGVTANEIDTSEGIRSYILKHNVPSFIALIVDYGMIDITI